ncbi:hypothetical protein C8R43DRAFT_947239 [Mycena crocata]|nr:hypothetical protein C8R43DRAFT_947239 [Mycena crocata]
MIRKLSAMRIDDPEYAPVYYKVMVLDTTGTAAQCVRPPNVGAERVPSRPNYARTAVAPALPSKTTAPVPTVLEGTTTQIPSTYPNTIPLGVRQTGEPPSGCFGCGKDHRMFECVEVNEMVRSGVLRHNDQNRLEMGDGRAIRKLFGENLEHGKRRAPLFSAVDPVQMTPVTEYYREIHPKARIEEVYTDSESDLPAEILEESEGEGYYIEQLENVNQERPTHRVFLTAPKDSLPESEASQVNGVERTVPSTRTARREAFDGVLLPGREHRKERVAKETITEAYPETSTRNNGGMETRAAAANRIPAAEAPPLPEPVPVQARKIRFDQFPVRDLDPKGSSRKDIGEKGNEAPTRSTGRQTGLTATVDREDILNRILDATVSMSVREVIETARDIRTEIQELIKVRNVKAVHLGKSSDHPLIANAVQWPRTEGELIRVEMETGGRPIIAIIDTGSQLDVVRADVAALVLGKPVDMTRVTSMNDANGGKGQLRGWVDGVEFNCGGALTTTGLWLSQQAPFELLLGRPWQRGNLISIDERNEGTYLVFKDRQTRLPRYELLVIPQDRANAEISNVHLLQTETSLPTKNTSDASGEIGTKECVREESQLGKLEDLPKQRRTENMQQPSIFHELHRVMMDSLRVVRVWVNIWGLLGGLTLVYLDEFLRQRLLQHLYKIPRETDKENHQLTESGMSSLPVQPPSPVLNTNEAIQYLSRAHLSLPIPADTVRPGATPDETLRETVSGQWERYIRREDIDVRPSFAASPQTVYFGAQVNGDGHTVHEMANLNQSYILTGPDGQPRIIMGHSFTHLVQAPRDPAQTWSLEVPYPADARLTQAMTSYVSSSDDVPCTFPTQASSTPPPLGPEHMYQVPTAQPMTQIPADLRYTFGTIDQPPNEENMVSPSKRKLIPALTDSLQDEDVPTVRPTLRTTRFIRVGGGESDLEFDESSLLYPSDPPSPVQETKPGVNVFGYYDSPPKPEPIVFADPNVTATIEQCAEVPLRQVDMFDEQPDLFEAYDAQLCELCFQTPHASFSDCAVYRERNVLVETETMQPYRTLRSTRPRRRGTPIPPNVLYESRTDTGHLDPMDEVPTRPSTPAPIPALDELDTSSQGQRSQYEAHEERVRQVRADWEHNSSTVGGHKSRLCVLDNDTVEALTKTLLTHREPFPLNLGRPSLPPHDSNDESDVDSDAESMDYSSASSEGLMMKMRKGKEAAISGAANPEQRDGSSDGDSLNVNLSSSLESFPSSAATFDSQTLNEAQESPSPKGLLVDTRVGYLQNRHNEPGPDLTAADIQSFLDAAQQCTGQSPAPYEADLTAESSPAGPTSWSLEDTLNRQVYLQRWATDHATDPFDDAWRMIQGPLASQIDHSVMEEDLFNFEHDNEPEPLQPSFEGAPFGDPANPETNYAFTLSDADLDRRYAATTTDQHYNAPIFGYTFADDREQLVEDDHRGDESSSEDSMPDLVMVGIQGAGNSMVLNEPPRSPGDQVPYDLLSETTTNNNSADQSTGDDSTGTLRRKRKDTCRGSGSPLPGPVSKRLLLYTETLKAARLTHGPHLRLLAAVRAAILEGVHRLADYLARYEIDWHTVHRQHENSKRSFSGVPTHIDPFVINAAWTRRHHPFLFPSEVDHLQLFQRALATRGTYPLISLIESILKVRFIDGYAMAHLLHAGYFDLCTDTTERFWDLLDDSHESSFQAEISTSDHNTDPGDELSPVDIEFQPTWADAARRSVHIHNTSSASGSIDGAVGYTSIKVDAQDLAAL